MRKQVARARKGVDSKPNRELTKNVLRGRKCETCDRIRNIMAMGRRRNEDHCVLSKIKPASGVCSQWKMGRHTKFDKNWKHKINVAKKRKQKREAKEAVDQAASQAT